MFGAVSRGLLLFAAVSLSMLTAANGAVVGPLDLHREAVDELSYPWSAVGKLYIESGDSCSGVVIARDKILTAAHCLFNERTQRFVSADSLHFLVGYRAGRYAAHARIARYEIGPDFNPLRYDQTLYADWAVLTVTETLPAEIEPLRLRRGYSPSGTEAVLVGYPQDRAFAMTADRHCQLRENINAGRLLLHTCRGIKGYSGAPILVGADSDEMQVAAIQIASQRRDGTEAMVAVPAEAIQYLNRDDGDVFPHAVAISDSAANGACLVSNRAEPVRLEAIGARLDLEHSGADELDIVSSIPDTPDTPKAGGDSAGIGDSRRQAVEFSDGEIPWYFDETSTGH